MTAGRKSLACDLLDLQCLCGFLSRDVYEADGAFWAGATEFGHL